MRYVVLIFGLLGVAGSGFIVYKWGTQWLDNHQLYPVQLKLLEAMQKSSEAGTEDQLKAVTQWYTRERALPFVCASAVLGLIGILVSFTGRGLSAAVLLIVTGAGPALLGEPFVVIYTGGLILAGFFSLFVRPRRPKRIEPDDEPRDD